MPKQKFAVFDIDGTIFRWQLFHDIVFELIKQKALPESIERAVAEPRKQWHARTHKEAFHDYEMALLTAFQPHVKGLSVASLEAAAQVVMKSSDYVYSYTRDLAKQLKRDGYFLLAVSGSFQEVVEPFAKKYGFDHWLGSRCAQKDGYFTGESIWMYERKADFLRAAIKEYDLDLKGSIAVGDSANDLPMFKIVDNPIVFNPTSELFEHAKQHKWKIVVERKNVAYTLIPDANGYKLETQEG